jgi:hypothetical protein
MQNGVSFRIPDFVGDDGTVYSEIEITIQSDDGNIRGAVQLVETLEHPRSIDNE